MTELEKASSSHKSIVYYSLLDVCKKDTDAFIEQAMSSFQAGAEWQKEQSPWIRTEDRLPEDKEPVLTSSSIYGTKLLVWNDHYKVWDDEDGDDCYCERDKIDAWMPIPE